MRSQSVSMERTFEFAEHRKCLNALQALRKQAHIQCEHNVMFAMCYSTVFSKHSSKHSKELSPHEDTILCNGDLIFLVPNEEDCIVRVKIEAAAASSKTPSCLSKQQSPPRKHLSSGKKRKQDDINSVLMAHARSARAVLHGAPTFKIRIST